MTTFFKFFAYAMVLLFLWAGYVQFNDPDSVTWVVIYGLASLGSLLFALGRLPYWVSLLLAIAYLVGAFMFWPETYEGVSIGEGDISNIERGRESLGLGITALVFLLYSWRIRTKKSL